MTSAKVDVSTNTKHSEVSGGSTDMHPGDPGWPRLLSIIEAKSSVSEPDVISPLLRSRY